MLIIWFLISLPFTILFMKTLFSLSRQPRRPPGPSLFSSLVRVLRRANGTSSNLHISMANLSKKYGPIMYFGPIRIIVISSAEMVKEAFKLNDLALSGRPSLVANAKLSYENRDIGSAHNDEYWREMRKLVFIRLFTLKQVNSFRPVREDEVSRMVKAISQRADHGLVNINEAAMSLSSDIICRVALGKRFDENNKFDKLLKDVQKFTMEIFVTDFAPMLGWIDRLTGKVSRLDKVFKEMDSCIEEIINEHLSPDRPASMDGDVVDLLIRFREEGSSSSSRIEWDHVKGVILNIFLAGAEATAASIVWAMTALIKNPSSLNKAQQEIRNVVGNKAFVDEDDINKLPYLNAVVKETLRFFPPDPLSVPRQTIKPCTIAGYEIQEKTIVFVNLWAIGRDPEYWENPTEFLPERFLHGNSTDVDFKGHDFGFLPFGSGRRQCPGMGLAVAQVELALANLLYSFDWELPDGMTGEDVDIESLPGITAHKKNALCLRAKTYLAV